MAVAPILMSTGTNLLKSFLYPFSTSPFLQLTSRMITWVFADWSVRMMLNSLRLFSWLSTMWHIDFDFPWFTSKNLQSKLLLLCSFLLLQPCSDRYLCSDTICYLHVPSLNHRLALLLWQLLRCKTHFSWHLPQLIHPPLKNIWKYSWEEVLYILISL